MNPNTREFKETLEQNVFLFKTLTKYTLQYKEYAKVADSLFKNKFRLQIFDILKKESMNALQLAKRLNISYVSVIKHIKLFKEFSLIMEEKQPHSQGQAIMLSSNGIEPRQRIKESLNQQKAKLIQKCYTEIKTKIPSYSFEMVEVLFNTIVLMKNATP